MDKYLLSLNRFTEIIKYYNPQNPSLLEIGSKDGIHAELLSSQLNIPSENVFTIEPNPKYYNKITNNYPEFNNYEVAFSNSKEQKEFYQVNSENDEINGISSLNYRGDYQKPSFNVKKIKVNATTGYEFLNENRLQNIIIKIDVEGHTYEVLEGFKEKIQDVHFLHIETELTPLWENQKTDSEVNNYLTSKGFFKLYSKPITSRFNIGNFTQYDQIWINTKYYKPTLDTYFDKIFYLNLDKDVDRNQHMLAEFNKWGIKNFERVPGFVFHNTPEEEYWRNFNRDRISKKYILGQLGCRRTHLEAIKLSLERNYSKVLILEDDNTFTQDPHNLIRIQTPESWDLLYFSGLVEPYFRNQIVLGHTYGVNYTLFEDILHLGPSSGMEIDNFYAKIIQHMSYNYNPSGKYDIKIIKPFNTTYQNENFGSNIQNK